MAEIRQNSDGSMGIYKETDGLEVSRLGGPKPTGVPGSGLSQPAYHGIQTLKLGSVAGVVATTGGAIAAWTNNLGYDIIVCGARLDVTTVSTGAANVNVGQTPTNVTTSSSNIIAAVAVGAAGIKQSTLAAKVKVGEFITVTGSADTSGLVMSVLIDFHAA